MNEKIKSFDKVDMEPLVDRQRRVFEKIKVTPMGSELIKTLEGLKKDDDFKWFAFQVGMGRPLWEEYWSVYKDTIEKKAEEVFSSLEKKDSTGIF